MALNTGQLNSLRSAFATEEGRHGKLDDFIMDLQGTGNSSINVIVNDLIFLKREMMSNHPDRSTVQKLLVSLHRRASKVAQKPTKVGSTLKALCNTIATIR